MWPMQTYNLSGFVQSIATRLEGISTMVAPMRAANWRSASGGIASSPWATRGSAAPAGGFAALWVVPPPGAQSGAQTLFKPIS